MQRAAARRLLRRSHREHGRTAVRTSQDYDFRSYTPDYVATSDPAELGWVLFATLMLGFAAVWNLVAGIPALTSSRVYIEDAQLVFGQLHTWGWILIILGIVQGFAVFTLLSGNVFARSFGIAAAGLNAIGQLLFVPAYPWWALAAFSVDVLIIYGLAVHGGVRRLRT
jgi:hypothetical protein